MADLLRSDSIYINHNISVDNLDPVSTYLGMFGDPKHGGLDKQTFLQRQQQYRAAEINSMQDVPRFLEKAWRIYECKDFINDASGSLCEIVDLNDANDPVISALTSATMILYIRANDAGEDALKERAQTDPKPLFYYPDFIDRHISNEPDDGVGVDSKEFARRLFPLLLEDRKPRYAAFANRYGFEIDVERLLGGDAVTGKVPDSATFIELIYNVLREQRDRNEVARANADRYLSVCQARAHERASVG